MFYIALGLTPLPGSIVRSKTLPSTLYTWLWPPKGRTATSVLFWAAGQPPWASPLEKPITYPNSDAVYLADGRVGLRAEPMKTIPVNWGISPNFTTNTASTSVFTITYTLITS